MEEMVASPFDGVDISVLPFIPVSRKHPSMKFLIPSYKKPRSFDNHVDPLLPAALPTCRPATFDSCRLLAHPY